ncbi:hypothetical protein ACFLXP_05045 [Chloroflexota bacterium]
MEKQDGSSSRKFPPEEELKHLKVVVRSVMMDASRVLGHIELLVHGAEIEEQMSLLDHYLDYTRRLCERDISEAGDQETEQL